MQDWEERLQRQLGKSVVELTGFHCKMARNVCMGKHACSMRVMARLRLAKLIFNVGVEWMSFFPTFPGT